MKQANHSVFSQVKQLLTVDSQSVANVLLASGDWILVQSYRIRGKDVHYVMGRIREYVSNIEILDEIGRSEEFAPKRTVHYETI